MTCLNIKDSDKRRLGIPVATIKGVELCCTEDDCWVVRIVCDAFSIEDAQFTYINYDEALQCYNRILKHL